MPRNVSGNYALPLPPVVSGEVIEADWANVSLEDIALALTQSLDRLGRGGMLAPFRFFDGTIAAPGAAWDNAPGTGFSRDAAGLHTSIGGTEIWMTDTNGITLLPTKEVFVSTAPSTANSLVNKAYLDVRLGGAGVGPFLPLTGGTLTGDLNIVNGAAEMHLTIGSSGAYIYGSPTAVGIFKAGGGHFTFNTSTGDFGANGSITSSTGLIAGGGLSVGGFSTLQGMSATTGGFSSDVTGASFVSTNEIRSQTDWLRVGSIDRGVYSNATGYGWQFQSDRIYAYGSPPYVQLTTVLATGAVYAYWSDERLKTVDGFIENALEKIASLDCIRYHRNELAESYGYEDASAQIGLVAQQVQEWFPEVVHLAPFDVGPGGESLSGENYLTIQYERLVPVLLAAIKQLNAKVDLLLPVP